MQTYYDPFLPSSPSEERLSPITGDFLSPNAHDYQPSPSHGRAYLTGSGSPNSPPSPAACSDYPPNIDQSSVLQSGQSYALCHGVVASSLSPQTNGIAQLYDGTNSSAALSDNEFLGLGEHFAIDLHSGLYLEGAYGLLEDPAYETESGLTHDLVDVDVQEPASASTSRSFGSAPTSRISNGTAKHSSHLMSPVLTDTMSPGSAIGAASPLSRTRLLGGGPMSRVSSQSTAMETLKINNQASFTQTSPAMTGSSIEVTPEPGTGYHLQQRVSPVVRIETYTRGDSPARVVSSMMRRGSKRSNASRSSSHLAAPNGESSEDEEHDYDDEERVRIRSRPGRTSQHRSSFGYEETGTARSGLDPPSRTQIASDFVPNFKDQEETAQIASKIADVEDWLARSETGDEDHNEAPVPSGRPRARTTGDRRFARADALHLDVDRYASLGAGIPGPGVLLKEESGNEESDDDDDDASGILESPPAVIEIVDSAGKTSPGYFPSMTEEPEAQHDAHPWSNPLYFPSQYNINAQPKTANAAMMLFDQRAADIETASRAATWGTRRMSEADLERIIRPEGLLQRLSISRDKGKENGERRGSFFEQAAAKLRAKRSNSNLKRKGSEPTKEQSGQPTPPEHSRKESVGSQRGSPTVSTSLRRMSSIGKRPKSPMLNTSGAVAAMTSQIAALGGNGSRSPKTGTSPAGAWNSTRNALKRKNRTDPHHLSSSSATDLGLMDLWSKQGGPPITAIASSPKETLGVIPKRPEEEEEDVDTDDDTGITMDFTPRDDLIIPTFDGFRANVRKINPRLPAYMVERTGHEQLRRYKKLLELKVKHAQAIQSGHCPSGGRCPQLGGIPTYFAPKGSQKESEPSNTGYSAGGIPALDEDINATSEGTIVPTQFPAGVPMPPVSRLPAEFECPLCFTIKKFQKPSDWSKHVHEDVQPFTCTFPGCSEPKSFKRKADWVRHENERHRQLEWWVCNIRDCSHKCYRRDNFVQHLVREHKLPEPKAKTAKPNKPAVRGPAKNRVRPTKDAADCMTGDDLDIVLRLVDECRHETTKRPTDERCTFCGNICNSWKKLTVHLSKHMEQISMPVLGLVEQKNVTPETIVSPIEQQMPPHATITPAAPTHFTRINSVSLSPHEIPLEMGNVKVENTGSFGNMQNAMAYGHNTVEPRATEALCWGHPANQVQQTGPETSQTYPQGTGDQYSRGYDAYHNSVAASSFASVGPSAGCPPSSVASNPVGHTAHLPQTSYAATPSYQVSMGHQQPYSTFAPAPQYPHRGNLAPSDPRQRRITAPMGLHYPTMSGVPLPQAPDDSPYYNGQQAYYSYQPQR